MQTRFWKLVGSAFVPAALLLTALSGSFGIAQPDDSHLPKPLRDEISSTVDVIPQIAALAGQAGRGRRNELAAFLCFNQQPILTRFTRLPVMA